MSIIMVDQSKRPVLKLDEHDQHWSDKSQSKMAGKIKSTMGITGLLLIAAVMVMALFWIPVVAHANETDVNDYFISPEIASYVEIYGYNGQIFEEFDVE